MKQVLISGCSIFLFAQTTAANTEKPFNNFSAKVSYAKTPLRFNSYHSYFQYFSIKASKGIDSANAFYRNEFEKAAEYYTDYLPLTAGSSYPLTGKLYGTDAYFSGNVGLGISTPTQRLEVNGAIASTNGITDYPSTSDNVVFSYTSTGGSNTYPFNANGNLIIQPRTSAACDIVFATAPTSGAPSTRMVIKSTGYIGIGTSAPTYNLQIHDVSFMGTATDFITNTYESGFYNTSTGGSNTYPFNANGRLVIQPRSTSSAGSTSQIIFATGGSTPAARMVIDQNGNIGIGTTSATAKLSVEGNISANGYITTKKLTVTQTGWSDYVFNKEYKLRSLQSLEAFINQNKHLPEVPTTKEINANGISVGDNQALLLKKIEELTLYVIDLNKKNQKLERYTTELKQANNQLKARVGAIDRRTRKK